jgi:hypothetical protein
MRTNQFAGKSFISHLLILTVFCVFTSVVITGCKKDNPVTSLGKSDLAQPAANLVPDEDETEYTMANYQDALDDVSYDGDRLIFNNLSHFVTTAMALDSIGDSTANVWFQNLGFTNSLYNEFIDAIDNMPDAETDAELNSYFENYANAVVYDDNNEVWDVNAKNGLFAKLLNSEHTAKIGGNVYYSDYNVDVTVSLADESLIPTYCAQGYEQDDENAIVLQNKSDLKTTAISCIVMGGVYNMGDITCGDPVQKKATVQMQAWKTKSLNGTWYSGVTIRIWHLKRGLFGLWFKDYRGSQVGGVFSGVYYNQAKIYGNSAYLHEYYPYKQGNLSIVCFSDVQICVAPMCSGETICRNW